MSQLKITTRLSYGVGQVAVSAKDIVFQYYFLLFFSTTMGLDASLVGFATLLALIVDAVSDPLMGGISDGWRSKTWGRRHLFMALSALPFGISLWLLFAPPAGLTDPQLFAWMLGFAIIVRLSLTVFFVPYIALNAELTTGYDARTGLTTLRIFFGNIFGLVLSAVVLSIFLADTVQYPDGRLNPTGYAQMGLTAGLVSILAILLTTFATRSEIPKLNARIKQNKTTALWSVFFDIITALKIPAFKRLALGYTLFATMAGIATALTLYLLSFFWGLSQDAIVVIALAMGLAVIPGSILAPILAKLFDKRGALIISAILFAAFYVIPVLGRFLGVMPENGDPNLVWAIIGFYFFGQIFSICLLIIPQSMMADVADVYELAHGQRQEGMLFSSITFAQKATFGIGALIAGLGLDLIKFPTQTIPENVPAQTLTHLGVFYGVSLTVLSLLALVFFISYPINRVRHGEILKALQTRRSEPSNPD